MLIFLALAVSCKKDDSEGDNEDPTIITVGRDYLYTIMQKWYYWYDLMPTVTKGDYKDPYELLEAMRYKKLDKWSFVADYAEFTAEMEGTFVGHGFRIGVDDSGKARIAMIYEKSPLHKDYEVSRGWIVKSINGTDIAPILSAGNTTAYNDVIGESKAGVTNTFVFEKPDGSELTVSSTKASFTVNSVLVYDTLHLSSGVTGHLVFESFIEPSEQELANAFSYFSANNVNNIIVDLRYNTGGYLYIAQELASYIAGNSIEGKTFAELSYNDKNQDQNIIYPFITTSYPLTISKMVVITTRSTASASEAVMNGLKPFVDIVSIGDTTNGKPVGMNGWTVGETYYIWPITFKIVNDSNEGDYFGGIAPNQIQSDDITHDFSDRNEACLKDAISYLETGSFSGKGAVSFKKSAQYSEKPSWMDNAFVREKDK